MDILEFRARYCVKIGVARGAEDGLIVAYAKQNVDEDKSRENNDAK